VPVLAGDNWGNSLGVEGFEAGPDTNTNASFNMRRSRFLQDHGHSAVWAASSRAPNR
jgi:hypothetical protein